MVDMIQVLVIVAQNCCTQHRQLMDAQTLCFLTTCCKGIRERLLQQAAGSLQLCLTMYAEDASYAHSLAAWLTTMGSLFGDISIDASLAAVCSFSLDDPNILTTQGQLIGAGLAKVGSSLRQLSIICLPLAPATVLQPLRDSLQSLQLVDAGDAYLDSLTRLTRLCLTDSTSGVAGSEAPPPAATAMRLSHQLPAGLRHLELRGVDIPVLQHLSRLTHLVFGGMDFVPPHLPDPAYMQHLCLFECTAAAVPLHRVSQMTALTHLGLAFDPNDVSGLPQALGALRHLRALSVRAAWGLEVREEQHAGADRALPTAADLVRWVPDAQRQLRHLCLRDVRLTNGDDAAAVAALSQLTCLDLQVTDVTADCMCELLSTPGALPQLGTLALNSLVLGRSAVLTQPVMRALCEPGRLPKLLRVFVDNMGTEYDMLCVVMSVMKPGVMVDHAFRFAGQCD